MHDPSKEEKCTNLERSIGLAAAVAAAAASLGTPGSRVRSEIASTRTMACSKDKMGFMEFKDTVSAFDVGIVDDVITESVATVVPSGLE